VETRRARFEFVSGIAGDKILRTLIEQRARNASTANWRYSNGADEDVLGGAASFYRGAVGVGPKIHHYRTRTTRIFLIFGLALAGGMLVPILTGHMNGNGRPTSTGDVIFAVFYLGGMTLGGLAAWFFASLRCEADGLRQNGVWGEQFLPWNQIKKFTFNGYFFTVSGNKKTIRFGVFLADSRGLKDEIERRSGVTLQNGSQTSFD
jgi:hypothetical protein